VTALGRYLDALFGGEPAGGLIELRWKLPSGGMGQGFIDCRDHAAVAAQIARRGAVSDVYVGVAPRRRCFGGRDAVERVHVLWADCDDATAIERLGSFVPEAAIVIRSGSGRHAYWPLSPPIGPDEAEQANRRLAHALGADPRATDAARILRPPGTRNFKSGPPCSVEVERLAIEMFDAAGVVGALPDPPTARPPARLGSKRWHEDGDRKGVADPLDSIAPRMYAELLTGQPVGRDGKITCPFHADRTPSLHVYDEPERGWVCYGCGRGGTIIDFAATLWGIEPRGDGFHELRRRLARELLRAAA
jgi:hypothetical protein